MLLIPLAVSIASPSESRAMAEPSAEASAGLRLGGFDEVILLAPLQEFILPERSAYGNNLKPDLDPRFPDISIVSVI